MRRSLALTALALVIPATATADGGPVDFLTAGGEGVTVRGSESRYVTFAAGRDTVLARIRRDGGQVLRRRVLPGHRTVPVVAFDRTAGGLSANGGTLVVVQPRREMWRPRTKLTVLDAGRLRVRERIVLRGDFSFDAISPDGGLMYLIQYASRRDPTRYVVRGYDLRARRLLPEPIVDPRAFGEGKMRGFPITRTTTGDGVWAYTLYDGTGDHPFIHALNTADRGAVCIDLPMLANRDDLWELRLRLAGGVLSVMDGRRPLALVDRGTFRVRRPLSRPVRAATADASGEGWILALSGGAVLLLAAGAALRRRRRLALS